LAELLWTFFFVLFGTLTVVHTWARQRKCSRLARPMANLSTTRTALVTGASAGIGRQLALLFAADGYDLVLVARRRERLEQLAEQLGNQFRVRVELIVADLRDPQTPTHIADELGRRGLSIDVLVNNAGFGKLGAFAELDVSVQLDMITVNVQALVHLTHLLLPSLLAQHHGHILNIGSVAGFVPGPHMAVYYATKAFVNSFSEALSRELRGSGVSVTVCCPGPTESEFGAIAGTNARAIRSRAMPAATVARSAYRAMNRLRVVNIPGASKLLVLLLRFMPRALIRSIACRLNRLAKS
jgi:short-subunit dehydrogenase